MNLLNQHNDEIHENAGHWMKKPLLRQVYRQFYEHIAAQITRSVPGYILELGSGLGKIKEVIPECRTSDIFPNPWLDQVENAYRLSCQDGAVSNLILFDVWHHLEFPGLALRDFYRVLAPGGRLILFEPAIGLLGHFIYGNFHHEPLGLNQSLPWMPENKKDFCERYYAAQGNAWRMFRSRDFFDRMLGFRLLAIHYYSSLVYVGSGGFRRRPVYPACFFGLLSWLDLQLSKWPSLFATRMLIVLEKESRELSGTES